MRLNEVFDDYVPPKDDYEHADMMFATKIKTLSARHIALGQKFKALLLPYAEYSHIDPSELIEIESSSMDVVHGFVHKDEPEKAQKAKRILRQLERIKQKKEELGAQMSKALKLEI